MSRRRALVGKPLVEGVASSTGTRCRGLSAANAVRTAVLPAGAWSVNGLSSLHFQWVASRLVFGLGDRKHPTPSLIGDEPQSAANAWRVAMEGDHDLRDASFTFPRPLLLKQTVNADAPAFIEAAAKMQAEHARLESLLGRTTWLAGERISIADVVCFPEVQLLLRAVELDPQVMKVAGFADYHQRYPRIAEWVKRIEALPGYELTYPPHWR